MNRLKLKVSSLFIIVFILLFLGNRSYAQQPRIYNAYRWEEIESSIKSGQLLRETLNKINQRKLTAVENGDEISEARSYHYEMLVRDKLKEDSLYFRNSAFIDSLLFNPGTKPVLKSLLHLMQARRINAFDLKNLKFKASTYETRNLKYNYAALTRAQRDSVVLYHWNRASSIAGTKIIHSKDLLWLSSTSAVFLFEPSQQDIAITEKIYNQVFRNRYMKGEPANTKIIGYPSNKFIASIDSLAGSKTADAKVFAYYREWMGIYPHDPEKSAYIETCIRKYFYTRNAKDSTLISDYDHYLLQQTNSTYRTVRAAAAFQLFNIYLEEGRKYSNGFKPVYSGYFKRALNVYQDHKSSLDSFDGFRTRMAVLLNMIKGQQLELTLENIHLPHAPVLLKAEYQNVPLLHYRIVKVSSSKDSLVPKEQLYHHLYKRAALVNDSIKLPDPGDYNRHAVYLKLEPLPVGKYYLLFSGNGLRQDSEASAIPFVVSNISAIDNGKQYVLLNRKTGHPLKGVKVSTIEAKHTANTQGIVGPDHNKPKKLLFTLGQDTLDYDFQIRTEQSSRYQFDKERYDDLEDFYEDHTRIMVYTDRGIYRPGQKVYFKAVLFSRNPNTGEQTIFNKNAGKAFTTWLKDNSPKINLRDGKRRVVDSLVMVPDDFGSFSGSFILPKAAITGDWTIDSDLVEEFYSSGRFAVEEYKRPSYEMNLEKPEEQPVPGRPFQLKLKLNSLSGALLSNVQIKYQLERSNQDPKALGDNRSRYGYLRVNSKLIDTLGFTNEKGELMINVADTALHLQDFNPDRQWSFNYTLYAQAIESSGEQVELKENYSISNWPVNISMNMASFYEKAKFPMLKPEVKVDGNPSTTQPLNVAIYEISKADDPAGDKTIDQWLYSPMQLKSWFPEHEFKLTNSEILTRKLVFSNVIDAANQQIDLNKANLSDGEYEIVLTAKKEGRTAGKFTGQFRVFDHHNAHSDVVPFSHLPANSFKAGDLVTYYLNVPDSTYVTYGLRYYSSNLKKRIKDVYHGIPEKGGLVKYQFKIPDDAIEKLILNAIYIRNNNIYNKREEIYLYKPLKLSPEIVVEKYRKVMAPGAKETFSVSVKTGNKNVAAQLMTTIYDAALDKLEQHIWKKPNDERYHDDIYGTWTSGISQSTTGRVTYKSIQAQQDIFAEELNGDQYGFSSSLAGIAAGVQVSYLRKSATGSFVRIRGAASITNYTQPLIVVDGVIYTGQLADFNSASITEAIVLKGADASAIYGSGAAQGVLIISTKGKIVLPGSEEAPAIKVRKNFNETAVFMPSIYADKDGLYTFSFTMPESATEWNWKMLAHTKEGVFAYAERKLHTRLNLMVQPHMPRLLYQGDELNLQSRISNMDSLSVTGNASCKIEDAVTGEDLTNMVYSAAAKPFSLAGKSNGYTAFKLRVPEAQVNPLKIVMTVVAGNVADAEEHIIPVMSRQIFVKQNMPLRFSARDTVVKSPDLPADALMYGVGLSLQPKPQAALINALPWLANYSYDCAEQTFNKMLAHVTALDIMRNDKNAQAIFTSAKQEEASKASSENKLTELPDDITKVVTPWLRLDEQQAVQQRQLLALLDTTKTKAQIDKYLQKIYELQNADGGMPWFTGGKSNAYISSYLLAGFGKLNAGSWKRSDNNYLDFIRKLNDFCDNGYKNTDFLYYAYARSFWPKALPANLKADLRVRLADYQKTGFHSSLRSRLIAILAITRLFSISDPLYTKAKADMESIRQMSISDPLNGMRWKEISDQDNLDSNTEEMIELLSMVFAEDQAAVKGMLQWLMTTRAEQPWATTTGTAAAVNLLMKEKGTAIDVPQSLTAMLGAQKLSVSDDLLNGKLVDFSKALKSGEVNGIKDAPMVTVTKTNTIPANGSLSWYYFTAAQNVNKLNTNVRLDKRLFVFSDTQKKWIAADNDLVFKIGTRVKVVLSIETQKPLTFVQLDDYRAAAFEPMEQKSGHQYQDRISYYQSIRDTGYQIFAEFIPSGKSELSYELKVVQEGSFANGPAVLSCMYKPEIAAYSNSFVIKTVK